MWCWGGWVVRPGACLVVGLLVAGCSLTRTTSTQSPAFPMSSPSSTLMIAGRPVSADGLTTVRSALRAAHMKLPDGRLLSVATHQVLDAHADPATVLVDGRPSSVRAQVHSGDVITFVPGTDRIERTRTVNVDVPLSTTAARLYANVTPGIARAVVGTTSREQISSTIIAAPAVGRLRAPARVALTFDDGPAATYTRQVLALLGRYQAPAVFCLVGMRATRHQWLVRREKAAGARFCDHTQTHALDLPQLSKRGIRAEIRVGYRAIMTADGDVAPVYFRAPGGNWSPFIKKVARRQAMIPLSWTVDPRDWSRPGTEAIVTRVLDQLRPDGVILLHDGGGDRSETVAALEKLLPRLERAGWRFTFPTWVR